MNHCIDFSTVVPLAQMEGDSEHDTESLKGMAAEAEAFIKSFDWCKGVLEAYFGCGIGGVVGVYFYRILPAVEGVDECLWVIVGDLPPAYLLTDESRTPRDALRTYIAEMRQWAVAAESGESVDDLIPVNIPPTREGGLALMKRLDFLESEILPYCE